MTEKRTRLRRSGATQDKCRHTCGPGPYKVLSELPCLQRSTATADHVLSSDAMALTCWYPESAHHSRPEFSCTTASPLIFWKRSSHPVIILTCLSRAWHLSAIPCMCLRDRAPWGRRGVATSRQEYAQGSSNLRGGSRKDDLILARQERGGCRSLQLVQQGFKKLGSA